MRIPEAMRFAARRQSVARAQERVDQVELRVASGLHVQRASDDPSAASLIQRLRSEVRAAETYEANIAQAMDLVDAAENALAGVQDGVRRASTLGFDGTMALHDDASREALALEVDDILARIVDLANTHNGGRYIFGGTQTLSEPFALTGSPPSAVTYAGDAGRAPIAVERGLTLEATVPGSALEAAGGGLFQKLIDLGDALRNTAGEPVDVQQDRIRALAASLRDDVGADVSLLRAELGARYRRLEDAADRLEGARIRLEGARSRIEDEDLAQGAIELAESQQALQAAMAVAARAQRGTLLDLMG